MQLFRNVGSFVCEIFCGVILIGGALLSMALVIWGVGNIGPTPYMDLLAIAMAFVMTVGFLGILLGAVRIAISPATLIGIRVFTP